MSKPALLCTQFVADHCADILDPVDLVIFRPGEIVPPADLERVTLAYFSGDTWPKHTASFIKVCVQAPNLRWLHSFSAGVDSPVFASFVQRGVRLTTSSGSSSRPIAQAVIWMLLSLTRNTHKWATAQQQHQWLPHDQEEVEGQHLAIIGMGPIGEETARLGIAFGMEVRGLRRRVTGDEPCPTCTFDDLPELLQWADVVVLALPLTPDTRGLIGVDQLALMKPTARLINVGRGALVDEEALIDALTNGRLAGAGLDVFAVEPLPADSPLWDLPNVIITPHNTADTDLVDRRATAIFRDNFARYLAGDPLRNEVFADKVGGAEPAR